MVAGLLRTDITIMILVVHILAVVPQQGGTAAVGIILPRSQAIEIQGIEGSRHGQFDSEPEQIRRLGQATGIFHLLTHGYAAVAIQGIRHLNPGAGHRGINRRQRHRPGIVGFFRPIFQPPLRIEPDGHLFMELGAHVVLGHRPAERRRERLGQQLFSRRGKCGQEAGSAIEGYAPVIGPEGKLAGHIFAHHRLFSEMVARHRDRSLLQHQLVVCHLFAGFQDAIGLLQRIPDIQQQFALQARRDAFQRDIDTFLRSDGEFLHHPRPNRPAILQQFPFHAIPVQRDEEVLVADPQGKRGDRSKRRPDVLVLITYFVGMRMQAAVGSDDTVAVKRTVRGVIFIEVAAKDEDMVGAALLRRPAQRLVLEVPDAAALERRILPDQVPVLLEVADGIPHRMGVFTLDERPGRLAFQILHALFQPLVHRTEDIGIPFQLRTFVLNRTRGVHFLDHPVAGLEIGAVARFVSQTPDNDAGMVEIPQHHPAVTHQVGLEEVLPPGQGPFFITHSMRFDISLVDYVETITVTQGVPARIIGIVAGSYRIDIQLLHNTDIANHLLLGNNISARLAEFVPIHTLDEHRLPVHQQLRVLDFHGAEAEIQPGRLANRSLAVFRLHFQSVQRRRFSAPEGGPIDLHRRAEHHPAVFRFFAFFRHGHFGTGNFFARRGKDGKNGRSHTRRHFCDDGCVAVHPGHNMHILNAFQLSCIEFHPTGDTRQAPEILVFEVGSVAPAHHLQFQRILALTNVFGEIETRFQFAVFAVADGLPVHTNLHVGRYAADAQADLLAHPVLIELEGAAIHASVIVFLGYERRIVLKMALPGVSHVDINRLTIALKFPHARHADRTPVAVFVAEIPLPVQRQGTRRGCSEGGCHR